MKSKGKYLSAVICCAAALAFSLSLPVLYGRRVDAVTFGKVSELEAEESIGSLAYTDNSDIIYSVLDTAIKAEELGISATPVYSVSAEDMSEYVKTKITEQITLLCDSDIIPDMTVYDIYDSIKSADYYSLYTPDNTLSFMEVSLSDMGKSFRAKFLVDPTTYCVYYCSFLRYGDVVPSESAINEDYFSKAADYYNADSVSDMRINTYDGFACLEFGDYGTEFEVHTGTDFFSCGIGHIRDFVTYYNEVYAGVTDSSSYGFEEYSALAREKMTQIVVEG